MKSRLRDYLIRSLTHAHQKHSLMSRSRDASPERPKDVLVEFQFEDNKRYFFCKKGVLTDKEIEMISMWCDSEHNIFVYYGGYDRWDDATKGFVPSDSPLPKEDQIAHALLMYRFGNLESEVLDGMDLSKVEIFEEQRHIPKTRFRHFVVTETE